MKIGPVALEGHTIRLEPVTLDHVDGLWHAGRFPEVWAMRPLPVYSHDAMREQVELALDAGILFMFATVDRVSGRVIGTTSFANIDAANRRLEIGATWLTPAWQRSPANTEAKYLQLRHCFDELHCVRVEFKTDARNARSRAALVRIGAVEEGTLRRHVILPDGYVRDSVYFSVLDREWLRVKTRLEEMLDAYPPFMPPDDW